MKYDLVVVGGGIVGLATCLRLQEARPGLRVAVVEKETTVGAHQSGHNSGVLHAGLYYRPGSRKARLAVDGLRQMVDFCRTHGIAHEQCGKIVIATDEPERVRLEALLQRGTANGLRGLRWLRAEEIAEIEPAARGLAAIHVPEEGIVDYPAVCRKLAELIRLQGGDVLLGTEVRRILRSGAGWELKSDARNLWAGRIVTCAGLHADRLVRSAGSQPEAQIIPFRGEYYMLRADRQHLVRNLIYPVPDPAFPFLGVHFTRMVGGGVEAGPNAVLAFAREGYRKSTINLREAAETISFPGLWRFIAKYPSLATYELYRSFSRAEFCRSLQRLVPDIREDDLMPGTAGVRAQAMYRTGTLVEDFEFVESDQILHVLNAPSPGATASLAIGQTICAKIIDRI